MNSSTNNIYEAIFEALPDPVILFDNNGTIISINTSFSKIYGYTNEEVQGIGLVHAEIITNSTKKNIMTYIHRISSGEETPPYRISIYNRNGDLLTAELKASVFINEDNYINMVVLRDISLRKKAEKDLEKSYNELKYQIKVRTTELEAANIALKEEISERQHIENALRESEEKYKASFSNSRDAINIFGYDTKLIDVNTKFIELTGYSREELLTMTILDLFPETEDSQERIKLLKEGKEIPLFETFMVTKESQTIPVEIAVGSLHHCYGQEIVFQSVIRDISQRKQMEEKLAEYTTSLEDANVELQNLAKTKDNFLSTISHELRTPLNSIKGFADILLTYNEDPNTQREFIGIINNEANRLTRLINDLLDLSRIESGKMRWESVRVDIIEIIKTTTEASKSLFKQKNISLVMDIPEKLPYVLGSNDKYQQVITNLLSNAIKFTPDEGEIRIVAGTVPNRKNKPDKEVIISVSDTGVGIDPANYKKIFEKFQQVGDVMTNKPQGTGLGLTICREIIEHYGGKIWVESELGKGSTFHFTIPMLQNSKE